MGIDKQQGMAIATELLTKLPQWWREQNSKHNPMLYQQMSVVALTRYAAILAVDLNMTEEQFVKVCSTNFQEIHNQSPKFG